MSPKGQYLTHCPRYQPAVLRCGGRSANVEQFWTMDDEFKLYAGQLNPDAALETHLGHSSTSESRRADACRLWGRLRAAVADYH